MMRHSCVLMILASAMTMVAGCGTEPTTVGKAVALKRATAPSTHYVLVEFVEPVGEFADATSSYRITGPTNESLNVLSVAVNEERTEAMLATDEQQQALAYELSVGTIAEESTTFSVPVGTIGFVGSSTREPFLESAVSLSSTQILLTFSAQMDKTTAENPAYYEIADPDGNTDIDIRVTAATLQFDQITVILTTTPQDNLSYTVRATNVKRRFTCDDEGRVFLNDAAQGTSCAGNYRPKNPDGSLTSFVLTARTAVLVTQPTNPNATGSGGSVGLEPNGAGVRRALCNGGSTGIDGGTGSDPDEELIFRADRPELAANVVLGVRNMSFGTDMPVMFISSNVSSGYDYVVNTAQLFGALSINGTDGDIVLANIPTLPAGLMIDEIKLRETNDSIWVHSFCGFAINRRLIDPTRNTASFWGIPPVDTQGPRLVSAASISSTEVLLSFSEPLNSNAADPTNYTITPGLTVTGATLSTYDTQVLLTTTPQLVNVVYTVTVANVKDKAGNLIDPAFNTATFSFVGGPGSLGADVLPRVVGAASTSNTTVLVVFSKPMGTSAEVASNYIIIQQNVNPEVGAIQVLAAAFLPGQQDAVELTTSSQNEVTYFLRAVNVQDLFGNQLAPPQLLVDPSTALFAGSPFSCGGAPCSPPDFDGDGLADHQELRGYVVRVEETDGDRIERQVTSDPRSFDTDGEGLNDAEERRIGCDPRSPDTDADQLSDWEEYNFVYSNQNDQDSDDDGVDDLLEVDFFKTNALLADSDGDGFDDGRELFEMNRDPRISDLPSPQMDIGTVNLQLEETFTYVDDTGVVRTEESSTSSSLSSSRSQKVASSIETSLGINIGVNFEAGIEGPPIKVHAKGGVEAGLAFGLKFQASRESTEETTNAFELSLSKGSSISNSTSFTRNVTGGRIDALVSLDNLSNVAFSLKNLEITVSAPNPDDRTSFIPVATLVPNSTLVTGNPAVFNIGALNPSRGPIMFTSRDVFPALVEDLMRDPRGLLFEFANFDLTDEFDRNFAFASQTARDRTVGLEIDFGDGVPVRYFVAYAPVRFNQAACDPAANPGCDIVGGFAGFANAGIPPYGGVGAPPGLPLEYILEVVLQKRRSEPVITAVWLPQPSVLPETGAYVCVGGFNDGSSCDPNQVDPDADCKDSINDGVCSNAVAADGILVGGNGTSDSIAQGDDVQLIPFGIDGLPEDALVVSAGENGILETSPRGDDPSAIVTGYATTKTCGPDTPSSIRSGPNGLADTVRDPFSDDVQLQPFGSVVGFAVDIIGPGPNNFIDTAPASDDVFVGPGIPCDDDTDCVSPGVCDGQEILFRFDRRARGQFGRIWAVLVPDSNLVGLDFRKVVLKPGEVMSLGFIQDLDRDGLISNVEFFFGSSDTRQDTDGDGLDDYSEIRVGWEIGVESESLRTVFPDPRLPDSDRDGLGDREEQDMRRVQCECVGGPDDGNACTRDILSTDPQTREACRTATSSCMNIANSPVTSCSTIITDNRLDPRRRDTDADLVRDADEVVGWLTQAGILDPSNVIVAGSDRDADTRACPMDVCVGGSNNGNPCRYQRDCPPQKLCEGGINDTKPCANDVDCKGPTPFTSGLCNETTASHTCNRTSCDDVQAVAVAAVGLDARTVIVAPGPNGVLETTALTGDLLVTAGDLRAQSPALIDDQQIALVDPSRVLLNTPLGRTIIRPGVDGIVNSLPKSDDVLARGQFLKITNPLTSDTDQDQISEGLERLLGSDPRDPTDGGFLGDKDGDGLTDGQEEVVGWTVVIQGVAPFDVHSNPNSPDSDEDGLPDYAEFVLRTNPNDEDTDSDGLSDFDELSAAQVAQLSMFNALFPSFLLDGESSAQYGTSSLNCDSDGDKLTDDFEIMVGWTVRVSPGTGLDVFQVFPDPSKKDTDGDGLDDGAEYKHTLGLTLALPTDPRDFDSDGDGKTDGEECSNSAVVLAACTNPTTQSLGTCAGDPLVADKKVTIRYTQLTVDRGNDEVGANTVDMAWRFQAQKSDEVYPGSWYGVRTDRSVCVAVGNDAWCYAGGYCSVPEGTDFIFQGPHCQYHGNPCTSNASCPNVGVCSFLPFIACTANSNCPLAFLGETCVAFLPDTCLPGNEVTYTLRPGEGILLNGEASQHNDCIGAECTSGPFVGRPCNPFNPDSCCPQLCSNTGSSCTSDSNCSVCTAGTNSGTSCNPANFSSTCCPRYCTGTTTSCTNNSDCASPATCNFDCTGIGCAAPAGSCGPVCGGITCEAPFADNHVIYSKTLSFETLQYGFSTDVARLTDSNDAQEFSLTLIVEILVE